MRASVATPSTIWSSVGRAKHSRRKERAASGSTAARQVHDGFPTATAAVFALQDGRPTFERLLRVKDFGGQA